MSDPQWPQQPSPQQTPYPQQPGYQQPAGYPQSAGPPPIQPQPVQAQVVPYATPVAYQQAGMAGAWRKGSELIITRECALPMRCVKCNADVTDGWRWRKKLYWHHPALALMILFPGLLIYAIVALIVRKSAKVEASLCADHRSRRNSWLAVTWFCGLGCFAALIGGFVYSANVRNGEWAIAVGLLGFVVMLILAIVFGQFARVLSPSKIDNQYAWLKGAGPDFLSNFSSVG